MVRRATNQEELFVLGDGNQIRVKIENHLYKNDFEAVKNVSESITSAIQKLRELAEEELDAEVIMAGGDDILFIMNKFQYDKNILKNMSAIFKEMTGCSFSFGVGTTIEEAHSNLNKAKVFKQTTVQTI